MAKDKDLPKPQTDLPKPEKDLPLPEKEISSGITSDTSNKNRKDSKTILVILLLIFLFPIGVIAMWFMTRWPKWIKFLITLLFIIGLIGLVIGVIIVNSIASNDLHDENLPLAPDPVACTQEVMICPDGKNYVGREGPNCEFKDCPAVKPGDENASEDIKELPETSSNSPTIQQEEELLPTIIDTE